MAEKQSILGRIAQLTKANINALIDKAEDPQLMLDQLVRDYTNNIAEAEQAVAQTIGNLRLAEQDYNADVAAVTEWQNKALAASRKADELRSSGDAAGADRYDNLTKVALQKQIGYEQEVKEAEPMLVSQREVVDKLKHGLSVMKDKLGDLKVKRDQLAARAKTAEAQARVQDAIGSINVLDPTSEIGRYEEQIRRQEALVAGKAEIQASSLDAQFAELEADADTLEVDARFAALKSGSGSAGQIGTTPQA
ncbi:MAG TPA: PspA/IM30 family protein [Candidatus Ruania gallistercoris]|uniref:PspA/IM30 family protein n=1 Tax=Candidatus Ruania gallistercoris TaxID=2838746 RepID=A0A9D2EH77_9MICO|nr:PspA/IM30 family protein [Candidatus Ruania gallistercoris]